MTEIRVEPAAKWPQLTVGRRDSSFKATYSATVELLEHELAAVRAQAVTVQLAVPRADLHTNALRATLKPEHPGVILGFTSSRIGKVRFTCDRFLHWHANLRAIALGMEALRKVDRYGITSDGQQYAGFRAIEAAEAARPFETVEQAAAFIASTALGDVDDEKIARVADALLFDEDVAATYFRRAARNAHPDAGGSEAVMARLNAARALLEERR